MMRRGARGVTWAESLAALALVGLAVLSATGVTLAWNRTARRLADRMVATEALASEMALLQAQDFAGLPDGERGWRSGADASCGLPRATGTVAIRREQGEPFRRVRVDLTWAGGSLARETLLEAR